MSRRDFYEQGARFFMMTRRLADALDFAVRVHGDQISKGTKTWPSLASSTMCLRTPSQLRYSLKTPLALASLGPSRRAATLRRNQSHLIPGYPRVVSIGDGLYGSTVTYEDGSVAKSLSE
jgi:hypothetical protein